MYADQLGGSGVTDAEIYDRYVKKRAVKDPYSEEMGPGRHIVDGLNDWLGENVVEPMADAGWPNAGAAIATVPSVVADFVIPQTAGDFQPGAVFIKGPKGAYKALRKATEKSRVLDEIASKSEPMFIHETAISPKKIMKEGLVPRVGEIVSGTSLYDEAKDVIGLPADLTFFRRGPDTHREGSIGGYAAWSTGKKLKKYPSDISLEELKKHGVITASRPDDIQFGDIYTSNAGWGKGLDERSLKNIATGDVVDEIDGKIPYQVEPGDYVTDGITSPSYILTGKDLIDFLDKNSSNHWVRGALERKK